MFHLVYYSSENVIAGHSLSRGFFGQVTQPKRTYEKKCSEKLCHAVIVFKVNRLINENEMKKKNSCADHGFVDP
jgi:hypothetical protein